MSIHADSHFLLKLKENLQGQRSASLNAFKGCEEHYSS